MKLTLSTINQQLVCQLEDKQLTSTPVNDSDLTAIITEYTALKNQSDNFVQLNQQLKTLGKRLHALINSNQAAIQQWANSPMPRQLVIVCAHQPSELEKRLLSLPWELLVVDDAFLVENIVPFEVLRRIGKASEQPIEPSYKDLTLMFMASDPDFSSNLNYEAEEIAIYKATRTYNNVNLLVNDSGNITDLCGHLRQVDCDMLHLSCHGGVEDGQDGSLANPKTVLYLEDKNYHPVAVSSQDFVNLATHVNSIFISACHSGNILPDNQQSLATDLTQLGIANVIGWDGSVADADATLFAEYFYAQLQNDASVPLACAVARKQLFANNCPHWHLGRSYLSPTGGMPLVSGTLPKKPQKPAKPCHVMLDSQKNQVKVASKETFVGRRRQTKQAIRAFNDANSNQVVLLYGVGGTGKSSLAARILDRMRPMYTPVVIYKHYEPIDILEAFEQADSSIDFQQQLLQITQHSERLQALLCQLLQTHFNNSPIVLIIDDLEQTVLQPPSSKQAKAQVKPDYKDTILAVVKAFQQAATQSRLLFTSRYQFSLLDNRGNDVTTGFVTINVPDMTPTEQIKHWLVMLQANKATERNNSQDDTYLQRIIGTQHGNAGLQNLLFKVLAKQEFDALEDALKKLAQHTAKQEELTDTDDIDKYLQRVTLTAYSELLTDSEQQLLRLLTLFDFAIPQALISTVADKLAISQPQQALQKLDNFGMLNHWSGKGLEQHISCYALVRKVLPPLNRQDKNELAQICAPRLWEIWFSDFLKTYPTPKFDSLTDYADYMCQHYFPLKLNNDQIPLTAIQQQRLGKLHRLCINNSMLDWQKMAIDKAEFLQLFEMSLRVSDLLKLRVSSHALQQLSSYQIEKLQETFLEELEDNRKAAKQNPSYIIKLLFRQFFGRKELARKAYQQYFGNISARVVEMLDNIDSDDKHSQFRLAITIAKTPTAQAAAYTSYAYYHADELSNYNKAQNLYEKAIAADPKHANSLGNYANFCTDQLKDDDKAQALYERAIIADPKSANHLGNYAVFCKNHLKDYDKAQDLYERAIAADPDDAHWLGSYARFSADQLQDYDKAQDLYERAIAADPEHANHLGNYGLLCAEQLKDYDKAQALYERAIEADPKHAHWLGNYANFCTDQLKDYDKAQALYERAITADPKHANSLGNYAVFCDNQLKDYAKAQDLYERAIAADSKSANKLGNYANFCTDQLKDHDKAQDLYERAIAADPNDANNLGNYAKLLFILGEQSQAEKILTQAETNLDNEPDDLKLELAFYRYAHCQAGQLTPVKQLLLAGVRSIGWNLNNNVAAATQQNKHPNVALLTVLAQVIMGDASIDELSQFPEWNNA